MKKTTIILPLVVVLVLLGFSSIFIVDERQKALVLQFGRVVDVKEQPGLYFKIPLIQEVVDYDDRILSRDIDPLEVTPLDDRRLVVDAFARYRISDVRQFRQANGTAGLTAAEARLDSILRSQTREVLGSVTSNEILSSDRAALMSRIKDAAYNEAQGLGIEIIDVRLKRTDLPSENLDATFARMRAEREREAADEIARGNERAQEIRAEADRKKVELVSDANRKAEIVRGQADAKRNAIYAEAFGQDPEFFDFYRSLNAYKKAFAGDNSTMVLSPDSEFFDYLKSDNPTNASPAPFDPSKVPAVPVMTDPVTTGDSSALPADPAVDDAPEMDAPDTTLPAPADQTTAPESSGTGDSETGDSGTGDSGANNPSLVPGTSGTGTAQ